MEKGFPEEVAFDPSLLGSEQELARQRKWCFMDKGVECAKAKRREGDGAFDIRVFKETPDSYSLSRIHLFLCVFVLL